MAEIQSGGGGGEKGRSKKMSTRVDFTPMVDLGFLLITFFMLATSLNKPKAMPLAVPSKDKPEVDQSPVKESKVLTLLLGANDKIYYYEGITKPTLDSTDYSAEGLHKIVKDKQSRVLAEHGKKSETIVLIKGMENARHKNMVDALDEMAVINYGDKPDMNPAEVDSVRYALLPISLLEVDFVKHPERGMNFTPEAQAKAAAGQE